VVSEARTVESAASGRLKSLRRFQRAAWARALLCTLVALAGILFATGPVNGAGENPPQTLVVDQPLARVFLPRHAAVEAGAIRLGDIATIESADPSLAGRLEALEVGRAALPGEKRVINVGTLRLRMRQARLPERLVEIVAESDAIEVSTLYQALSRERLQAVVADWYAAHAALPEGAVLRIEVDVEEQRVPLGAVEIGVGLSEPRFGSVAAPLEIRIDGRPYKRVNASVKAFVEQQVWVASRAIGRGEVIGPSDVILATRLFAQAAPRPLSFETPVRATRPIREGAVLTWDVVEPVPDVHKGDQVVVVATIGGVVVQVPGEAMSDGRTGERVAVKNLGSGNVVYGVLTEDGTVLVEVP